jgi:2-polyprenyl-3-methyl-5-hydroxy-6-metoxy-1,4-benzoquinol methylase
MADPTTTTVDTVRERMHAYSVDTACHFEPGAWLEPRYLVAASYIPDGVTILDAGCNTGAFGKRLMHERKGITLYGVEPNPQLAYMAKHEAGYTEVHVGLIEDVVERVPPVDFVVAMDPLDYCIDLDACMTAMLTPLKPGGIMFAEGVHVNGRWGDPTKHPDLMRSWVPQTMVAFLERWLSDVTCYETRDRLGVTCWVHCVGRRRA